MFENVISTLGDFMSAHTIAALAIVFVVAAGEAIFVLGLFVPSTVVLIGAGALVGTGKLPFVPVFLLTTAGAVAGDALSYWFGHRYRFRILGMWPFKRYPRLLHKGEAFFQRYGASSVFLGRFVPGIKSVIPGIAGMMGMSTSRFSVINVVSAGAWAAVHIVPAMGIGMGLKVIDPANPRFLLLAAALAIAAWPICRSMSAIVRIAILLSGRCRQQTRRLCLAFIVERTRREPKAKNGF